MISIDFETRSKADIWKVGAWKYAEDPSTEVLCMAYAVDDSEVGLWVASEGWGTTSHFFEQLIDHGEFFEAHNSFFELAIWKNIMVKRHGFPEIPDDQWSCTAAKAAAHALPRALAKVGAALNLDIQKDEEGRRVMLKLAKPRKPTKNDKSEWHNDPKDFEKLYEYCKADVETERCLSHRLRDLNKNERKIWLLDQKINMRGVRVDLEAVKCALSFAQEYKERFVDDILRLTDGYIKAATQSTKLKDWINDQGVAIENVQKATVAKALEGDLPENVRGALEIRQKLSKSSIAKYQAILNAICADGRMRGLLMYHGASTGRWTGKLFQPHNLPVNKFVGDVEEYFDILKQGKLSTFEFCYPDVMDTLSYNIRGCLIPTEGNEFFSGDYNAVEARVLLWFAGDEKALDIFRAGEDIYLDLANEIYGRKITEKGEERDLAKRGVLGCGYGMGHVKFKDTCATYGLEISEELAEKVVKTYRSKYDRVVKFWKDQEDAAMKAVITKEFVQEGRIGWGIHNGFLFCRLPSGRCLAYFHPKIEPHETPWGAVKDTLTYMHVNPKTKKWERTKTYGGKITENIVQATARDLMAEAMVNCEENGYEVVLSVHDELITENCFGSVEEFEQLMGIVPEWAEGLPVKVEGWQGKRYLK